MKKLFTIDDFMVAFVSALGYGFGETISRFCGWPKIACAVASFVLGIVLERIISTIAFSKTIQKTRSNRIAFYAVTLALIVGAQCVSVFLMGVSMADYIVE